MIEPINATFDELVSACARTAKAPDPSLKKHRHLPRNLAYCVAEKMWLADQRPCRWDELARSEKMEWIVMARAAIKHIKGILK